MCFFYRSFNWVGCGGSGRGDGGGGSIDLLTLDLMQNYSRSYPDWRPTIYFIRSRDFRVLCYEHAHQHLLAID